MAKITRVGPCIVCRGGAEGHIGVWEPLPGLFGMETPREILYPLCPACGRRAESDAAVRTAIEDKLIGRCRAGAVDKRWRRRFAGASRLASAN